ncbi:udp-glucose 4-epimerase-like protein 1 [Dermatophagoides farinae]|uniref:UDP-glucose 4-epimerase n=1 Tax=Dermatophagoides farinae TaxID=6954 RepID=A0A9D4SJX6_DERFA|nr:UDP-glucose 4-epimerase-like [Dermatophagoides farinae]KAH7644106.1 udp-glucose 4-epimerase-like protein 1 [Dermatophagoides farinae]
MDAAKILITGGSGYVGSHCVVELLENNFNIIVIDNLVNSIRLDGDPLPESLRRAQQITGKNIDKFYNGTTEDAELLDKIFIENSSIDVVMHLAALKSVGESVQQPLRYYQNNVGGSITLLKAMEKYNVKKFIFSSSATVYGEPQYLPLDESHPIGIKCTNPYGRSKCMVEQILEDVCQADSEWSIISLRYFNPVGAHQSGLIGEYPNDIPNNLMPYISQVAVKVRPCLNVFGDDYPTVDGTGVRDYIHIDDLSNGHIVALKHMLSSPKEWFGYNPINLGTGSGTTVLQLIESFEKSTGIKIPYKIVDRRPGDLAILFANVNVAKERLGWKARKTIDEMCSSTWNWQSKNPNGFRNNKIAQ